MVVALLGVGRLLLWIQFHTHDFFIGDQEFGGTLAVAPPDFGRDFHRFVRVVGVVHAENDGHHESTNVFKGDTVEIGCAFQQSPLFGIKSFKEFLIRFARRLFHRKFVVVAAVVEVFEAWLPIDSAFQFLVSLHRDCWLFFVSFLSFSFG